jgi:hypothetical protein
VQSDQEQQLARSIAHFEDMDRRREQKMRDAVAANVERAEGTAEEVAAFRSEVAERLARLEKVLPPAQHVGSVG